MHLLGAMGFSWYVLATFGYFQDPASMQPLCFVVCFICVVARQARD